MWIMLNDAFFSLVSKDCAKDEVLVRARIKGDLEKVFNNSDLIAAGFKTVTVTRYTKSDYLYRAVVKRDHMKAVMAAELDRVVYSNFKASTRDNKLHDAYNGVWSIMSRLQELPPYSGNRPTPNLKSAPLSLQDYGDYDDLFSADPKKAAGAADKKSKKAKGAKS